jgi:hypothetical protein
VNPLYAGSPPREPSLVFFAGIIGVPWQDIQQTQDTNTGQPFPTNELHFKTATDMAQAGDNTWHNILSTACNATDPTSCADNIGQYSVAGDALMLESNTPRTGSDMAGQQLLGPNTNKVDLNAIPNGHEWNIVSPAHDDLEYACIFPLPAASQQNCDPSGTPPKRHCDCTVDPTLNNNNPLCQDQNGAYGYTQFYAKGYPGRRELQVLHDYGKNSIIGSICPRNLNDPTAQDYGYSPAVDAIVDRLKEALTKQCLPVVLQKDPQSGKIPCTIVEGRINADCSLPGRSPADPIVNDPARQRLADQGVCGNGPGQTSCDSYKFCNITEVANPACHQANADSTDVGWCYVDPANQPGDDADGQLTKGCQPDQKRVINFIGDKTPAGDATVLIACFGAQSATVMGATNPNAGNGGSSNSSGSGGSQSASSSGGAPNPG